jgi:hypothetical protein
MYANMRAQIIQPSFCFVGTAILPVREVWRKGVPVENQNVRNQCKTTSDARTRTSFLTLRDLWRLLAKAQQKGLSALEINTSFGAEGIVLFQTAEIVVGHVLP